MEQKISTEKEQKSRGTEKYEKKNVEHARRQESRPIYEKKTKDQWL